MLCTLLVSQMVQGELRHFKRRLKNWTLWTTLLTFWNLCSNTETTTHTPAVISNLLLICNFILTWSELFKGGNLGLRSTQSFKKTRNNPTRSEGEVWSSGTRGWGWVSGFMNEWNTSSGKTMNVLKQSEHQMIKWATVWGDKTLWQGSALQTRKLCKEGKTSWR